MTVSPIVLVIGISLASVALLFGIIQPSLARQLIDWFIGLLSESPKPAASAPGDETLSGSPSPSSAGSSEASSEPSKHSDNLIP